MKHERVTHDEMMILGFSLLIIRMFTIDQQKVKIMDLCLTMSINLKQE
jgi:hypothetical protein